MADPVLSIIIPCLNEMKTLPQVLEVANEAVKKCGIESEIIVADNGSTDSSQEIARELGARVIDVPLRGYGSALFGGIENARGKYIIMGDADDTYDFSEINRIVEKLEQGYELVMGTRLRGSIEAGAMPTLHQYLGTPVLTFLINRFFGTNITDCNCGMRGFTREAFERMELHSAGMEFASEMIIKAGLLKMRICEVPVSLRVDRRGRPPHLKTWQDGWRHLRFILAYAADQVMLIPGIILIIAGLIGFALLYKHPFVWGNIFMDYHFLFPSSLAIILGTQLVLFTLLANTFTGLARYKRWQNRLNKVLSVEIIMILGLYLILSGLVINLAVLCSWLSTLGHGLFAIRPAIVALTLMAAGAQIFFNSIFIGVLKIPQRSWVYKDIE
jgi:glycosyltransferase involved in cell wall biosynthesis